MISKIPVAKLSVPVVIVSVGGVDSKIVVVEDPSMGEQEVEEAGALAKLEGVPALVGEQGAHVDGKVLLVGQRGKEREAEPVVVRLVVDVRRQAIVGSQILCTR